MIRFIDTQETSKYLVKGHKVKPVIGLQPGNLVIYSNYMEHVKEAKRILQENTKNQDLGKEFVRESPDPIDLDPLCPEIGALASFKNFLELGFVLLEPMWMKGLFRDHGFYVQEMVWLKRDGEYFLVK